MAALFAVLGVAQPVWPCQPPPSGLVAWWPFDEIFGTVAGDLSGNLNTARYSGHAPVPAAGKVDGALAFDGTGSYVGAAPFPGLALASGRFTLGFWIHPDSTEIQGTLFLKGPADSVDPRALTGQGVHLLYVDSGRFVAVLRTGDTAFEAALSPAATISAPPGVWTFATVTVDLPAHAAKLYLDGALANTVPLPAALDTITNTNPLFIGGLDDPSPSRSFHGLLDEMQLFDRVLAPDEISGLFATQPQSQCKETCHVTRVVPCTITSAGGADMTICNDSARTHSYNWSFASLPGGGGFCNLDGPSSFSPGSGGLAVAPGDCVTVPVQIGCPENPPGEGHGCFDLKVENPDAGAVLTCSGSYQFTQRWIWKARQALYTIPAASSAAQVIFDVTNRGAAGTLAFELNALPADRTQPSNTLVSLDGRNPGVAVRGAVTVPAGETRQVQVDASFLAYRPFEVYDVVVSADLDGGGAAQVASAGLRSLPADCNRNGHPDSLDLFQGNSHDCNSNGIPDECDLASGRETDCNRNHIPDSCDLAAGHLPDLDGNHVLDLCESSSLVTRFSGTAAGGTVSVTIQGFRLACTVRVVTTRGETAAAVAASLAAAANSLSYCLADQGLTAVAAGDSLVLRGLVQPGALSQDIEDPGLGSALEIPTLSTLGLFLLAALLMLCGTVALLRR